MPGELLHSTSDSMLRRMLDSRYPDEGGERNLAASVGRSLKQFAGEKGPKRAN